MGYKKDMSKYEYLEGWERCSFGEQLDKWAEKYGERTAVTDSEEEISYMELKQKARGRRPCGAGQARRAFQRGGRARRAAGALERT